MRRDHRLIVLAAGLVALPGACGPQPKSGVSVVDRPERETATSEGVSASAVAGPATGVDLADGAPVTGGGQPAFAPPYPGGTVVTTMTAAEHGSHGGVFAFTTADPAERVFTFYRSEAEAGGLTSQTNVETAGGRVYSARGAQGDVAVSAAPDGSGKTYVQVTWSAKG